MANFLEQLVAEWYEFNGYFVRRNVRVGPRAKGGHEEELDIVAFHPVKKNLVHVEPSMDADRWDERESRFARKLAAGKRYIPELFAGIALPTEIEQIALLVTGSAANRSAIGGGRLMMIQELMGTIRTALVGRRVDKAAIPEQYVILRTLQFAANYWR